MTCPGASKAFAGAICPGASEAFARLDSIRIALNRATPRALFSRRPGISPDATPRRNARSRNARAVDARAFRGRSERPERSRAFADERPERSRAAAYGQRACAT